MDLSRRASCLARLLAPGLLALLTACGDAPTAPTPRGESEPPREAAALEAVEDAARAAFALDRLVRGPLPRTQAFAIPDLHTQNLMHAQADLIALPEETVRLLSDPDLRRRLTSARPGSRNAWHGILDVLKHLDPLPEALALAWTEPALTVTDVTLMRRAVGVLVQVPGDGARELLLGFLAARPRDRDVAGLAGRALVTAGSPWREQALRIFYREGAALGWGAVAGWLDGDEAGQDALVAWSLLAETGAPRPTLEMRRTEHPAWYPARLLLDPCVWPDTAEGQEASLSAARIFAPARVQDGGGYLPEGLTTTDLVPVPSLAVEGKFHAADARCRLARQGVAFAIQSVAAERKGVERDLADLASACRIGAATGDDLAQATDVLDQFLQALDADYAAGPEGVPYALDVLGRRDPEGQETRLLQVLEAARPRPTYTALMETVQDMLLRVDRERLHAWVLSRFDQVDDPTEAALAMRLIRRRPSMAYVPRLLEEEAADGNAFLRDDLRRLLLWVHAAADDVTEEARELFVERVDAWIAPLGDRVLVGLLPGLLDLGEAGARAYVAGLEGPRRALYVEALTKRATLMPHVVAEALLAQLDGATSARERRMVLVAAYMGAPATAASALAAARERLDPAVRSEADDVLEVVRHRARR